MTELRKEIDDFVNSRPPTKAELDKVKINQILKLPDQWETNAAVNGSVANLVKYNLPDEYYQKYDDNVRNPALKDVLDVSKKVVRPDDINWFIVGDRAKIADKFDELGFDAIIEIDADGNPLKPTMENSDVNIKN